MLKSSFVMRARPLFAAVFAVAVIVGCDQNFESGSFACPALCPEVVDSLRDTTFYPVEYDTSMAGFPNTGTETELILSANSPLDLRAVVRFDTLQTTFRHHGTVADSDITSIQSAVMKLLISDADTLGPPVTFEVYDIDVDSTDNDTTAAVLTPAFVFGNRMGAITVPADSLKDSVVVPLDTAMLMTKIRQGPLARLRVGIRIEAPTTAEVRIFSVNGGFSPHLFIRPSADTSIDSITVAPFSKTPSDEQVASDVADFQLVSSPVVGPGFGVMRVGGIPGWRSYLRFNIPAAILESSSVVRATLTLTQRSNLNSVELNDTAGVEPFELASSSLITDIRRSLIFLSFGMDTAAMAPKDSGPRDFEMIQALRRWRFTKADRTPRAIALRATREGNGGWQADFYSAIAPANLRPRMRITYIPQPKAGLP